MKELIYVIWLSLTVCSFGGWNMDTIVLSAKSQVLTFLCTGSFMDEKKSSWLINKVSIDTADGFILGINEIFELGSLVTENYYNPLILLIIAPKVNLMVWTESGMLV